LFLHSPSKFLCLRLFLWAKIIEAVDDNFSAVLGVSERLDNSGF
jgi:hypothetical protein